MNCWKGDILLQDGKHIHDVHFSTPHPASTSLPTGAKLQFLSLVDTSRLPLHIAFGPRLDVWTTQSDTQSWFSSLLLGQCAQKKESAWWQTARIESPLGILASVNGLDDAGDGKTRATEILFFLSRGIDAKRSPTTPPPGQSQDNVKSAEGYGDPTLRLHALALSSHLLFANADDLTPPPSPPQSSVHDTEGVFLPLPAYEPLEPAVESRKRKSILDTFDAVAEARKRARLRPNNSPNRSTSHSQPDHRRSISGSIFPDSAAHDQHNPPKPRQPSISSASLQIRPLSRSPSLSSSHPPSRRAPPTAPEAPKRSHLSRAESVSVAPHSTATETETKNKDLISRLVMAGMRLHGLSQSRSKKPPQSQPRASASAPRAAKPDSQTAGTEKEEEEEEEEDEKKREKAKDDEYRLIYHQTYKGACFTFRTRMGEEPLQPWSDKVRETVDRLLALFCSDPFAQGLTALDDKLTPGGREAFGADRKGDEEEEASPFPKPTGDVGKEEEEEVKTPSWRKVRKEKDKTTTVKVMDVT